MGVAYRSTLAEGDTFTTIELKINFLRPVWKAKLRAEARMVRAGKIVGLVECDILDERQRLVARASSTCMTLLGRLAEGRQLMRNQLDELRPGQPAKTGGATGKGSGLSSYPEQIDADERLPGYLREPHLPRFESRRTRNFAKQRVSQGDPLSVLPPSETNADRLREIPESDAANTDAISASQGATC